MITKPVLPPKSGYVEVDVDGVRTYRNVKTGLLIDEEVVTETEVDTVSARLDNMEQTLDIIMGVKA